MTSLATAGDPVLGGGGGLTLAGIFQTPQIDSTGTVAFAASVAGAGVTFNNDSALLVGAPGALTVGVREGDAAPGTVGVFDHIISTKPFGGGVAVGSFSVTGDPSHTFAYYSVTTGGAQLIYANGQTIDGGTPSNGINSLVVGPAGDYAFNATLNPSGQPFDGGLWVGEAGNAPLLRLGNFALVPVDDPVLTNLPAAGPLPVAVNADGTVLYRAGTATHIDLGLIPTSGDPSALLSVALSRTPVPGTIQRGALPLALNDAGAFLYRTQLIGPSTDTDTVLVRGDASGLDIVLAREGDPVIDAPGGLVYSDFATSPALSRSDVQMRGLAVAITRRRSSPSGDQDYIVAGVGSQLHYVIGVGDQVPGLPDGTTLTLFTRPMIDSSGHVVFKGFFRRPDNSTSSGVWVYDSVQKVFHQVLLSGDTVPFGQTTSTAGFINLFDPSATGPGGSALTDDGRLVFSVSTFDGSAVIQANLNAAPPTGGAVGDQIFLDVDGDGLQDGGEPGFADVTVQLFSTTDAVVGNGDDVLAGTQVTAGDGLYQFANVSPGQYYLKFTGPAGFGRTLANVGSDDTVDSDADVATGNTTIFSVSAGSINTSLDAGFVDNADHAPPTVMSVDSPDIVMSGLPFYTFDVTFADPSGIDINSLYSTNIIVRGPRNYVQTAGLMEVDVETSGSPRKATYIVAGAAVQVGNGLVDFRFFPYHNGLYTISLKPNEVKDTLGNTIAVEQVIGEFTVRIIDLEPPTAELLKPLLSDALTFGPSSLNQPDLTLEVEYLDGGGLNLTTIDSQDVLLRKENGQTIAPIDITNLILNEPLEGLWRYRFPAPGGTLDQADDGEYDLILRPDQVGDLVGNFAGTETIIGHVRIDFSPPTAVLHADNVLQPGASAYDFSIDWIDPSGVDVGKLLVGDMAPLEVVGPGGNSFAVENVPGGGGTTFEYVLGDFNRTVIRTFHRITPPGGAWSDGDEGTYQINGLNNFIFDGLGNHTVAPATSNIGSFNVQFGVMIEIGGESGLTSLDIEGTSVDLFTLSSKDARVFVTLAGDGITQFADPKKKKATVTGKDLLIKSIEVANQNGLDVGFIVKSVVKDKLKRKVGVGNIKVTGPLKAFEGAAIDLAGSFIAGQAVNVVKLNSVQDDHLIQIGPPVNPNDTVTLILGSVANTDIISQTPIKSLAVTEWIDDDGDPDTITAPWIGSITTKGDKKLGLAGDFEADLVLSGVDAPKGVALGSAKIAGSLREAVWDIGGASGAIAASTDVTDVTIDADRGITSLKFGDVSNTNVTAGDEIKSIQAARWLDGEVVGPQVSALKITGDRKRNISGDASLGLLLAGLDNGKPRLGSTSIAGSLLASAWMIYGDGKSVSVTNAVLPGFAASFNGELKSFTAKGPFDGLLSALSLGSFSALSMTGASVHAGTSAGADGVLGNDDDMVQFATLKSIKVTGDVSGSLITVGVASRNGTFFDGDDDFAGGEIKSPSIGGDLSNDSMVAAGTFPKTVSINKLKVDPTLDARFVTLVFE